MKIQISAPKISNFLFASSDTLGFQNQKLHKKTYFWKFGKHHHRRNSISQMVMFLFFFLQKVMFSPTFWLVWQRFIFFNTAKISTFCCFSGTKVTLEPQKLILTHIMINIGGSPPEETHFSPKRWKKSYISQTRALPMCQNDRALDSLLFQKLWLCWKK